MSTAISAHSGADAISPMPDSATSSARLAAIRMQRPPRITATAASRRARNARHDLAIERHRLRGTSSRR